MTYFIGISGPIASGKSHLGKELTQHYSTLLRVSYWPFATTLKIMTEAMTDNPVVNYSIAFNVFASFESYSIEAIDNAAHAVVDAWENHGKNVIGKKRKFMQLLGHEIGRGMLHPDVWVRDRAVHTGDSDLVISDDVRYNNEADASHVHIAICPTASELDEIKTKYEQLYPGYTYDNHQSEQSLTRSPNYTLPYMFTSADLYRLYIFLYEDIERKGIKNDSNDHRYFKAINV